MVVVLAGVRVAVVDSYCCAGVLEVAPVDVDVDDVVVVLSRVLAGARGDEVVDAVVVFLACACVDVVVDVAVVVLARDLDGARAAVVDCVAGVLACALVDVYVDGVVVVLTGVLEGARVNVGVDVSVVVFARDLDGACVDVETVRRLAEIVKNLVENSWFPQCLVKRAVYMTRKTYWRQLVSYWHVE